MSECVKREEIWGGWRKLYSLELHTLYKLQFGSSNTKASGHYGRLSAYGFEVFKYGSNINSVRG
jgi:hypothetical protein